MTDYEEYQLQWMIDHRFSLKDLMDKLTQLQYDNPEDGDRISTPIDEIFDEWEQDFGFDSEIWACEEEWMDQDRFDRTEGLEMDEFNTNKNVAYRTIAAHIFTAHLKYEGNKTLIILADNIEEATRKAVRVFGSSSVFVRLIDHTKDPQVYEV